MAPKNKDWQKRLPRINEDNRDTDKIKILARYQHQPSATYFYVAQGQPIHGTGSYLYWGFAVIPSRRFALQITVSSQELESGAWLGQKSCKVDEDFQPGPWLAIKNSHFPPNPPLPLGRINGRGRTAPATHPHILQ